MDIRETLNNPVVKRSLMLATLAVFLLLPLVLESIRVREMGTYFCFAIAAISLNLIWGYTGILSLGHGVFFALGGYVMAFFLKLQSPDLPESLVSAGIKEIPGWMALLGNAWIAFPLIILIPALFAFLIGWPTFKSGIKGVYFTILSQALALALALFFVGQQPYTGGTSGINNFKGFFGVSVYSDAMIYPMFFVALAVLVLVIWGAHVFLKTKTGNILVAIRDGENRLKFLGYRPDRFKLFVYVVSAALAGLAGALFTVFVGNITPSAMGILPSVEIAIWVLVGGLGTLFGPVIGAIAVGLIKTFVSETLPEIWLYFFGAIFIATVLFFPKGIAGLWQDWLAKGKRS